MILKIEYPSEKDYVTIIYPAGEQQIRFNILQEAHLNAADEVYIMADSPAVIQNPLGLALLADALNHLGIVTTLFLPYLPYARADRLFVQGDSFGLGVFAKLINSMKFDKVVTLDAHSDQSEVEIDNLVNVSPQPFIDACLEGKGMHILLPDDGSSRYGYSTPFRCSKKRNAETGKFEGFTVPTKEAFKASSVQKVLIIDDICDGGGTFLGIADELKDYGLELNLYVTHGIFSKGVKDLLQKFKTITTTDSFWNSCEYESGVTVIPSKGVMLDAVTDRADLWEMAAHEQGKK